MTAGAYQAEQALSAEGRFMHRTRFRYLQPHEMGLPPEVAAGVFGALLMAELHAIRRSAESKAQALRMAIHSELLAAIDRARASSEHDARAVDDRVAAEIAHILACFETEFAGCLRGRTAVPAGQALGTVLGLDVTHRVFGGPS